MVSNFFEIHFKKFIIFSLVGVCAFIVDWLVFNLFYKISSRFLFSLSLGWIISMILNFTINRNITFSARNFSIRKQAFRWLIVYFIAFLARAGVGKLVLLLLGENPLNVNFAFFAGIIISIPISFLGSLLWAFKKNSLSETSILYKPRI